MPIIYTNRKGRTYILCKGTTKTGKPRYFFTREPKGEVMDHIPEGYEIRENVNGQVSLAKKRPQLITPHERAAVERTVAKHPKARNFRVDVKQKQIIVYENEGPDMEALLDIFQQALPVSRRQADDVHALQEKFSRFSPILRFILDDAEERTFRVERMTYTGRGGWRPLYSTRGHIKTLAEELIPLLDTDEFFELF